MPEAAFPLRSARRFGLAIAALALLAMAGTGAAAPSRGEVARLVAEARANLNKGDGIGAEVKLRAALKSGAGRDEVAALMGDAFLRQGDLRKAREWLGPGVFVRQDAALGLRNLGLLERLEGNFEEADAAYREALELAPKDAVLWVEISRLQYMSGQHLPALDSAERALAADATNPRALELKGQIVRDQLGLGAALPWFAKGLETSPEDLGLLGEYAATLGDLGRAKEMLVVTRRMLDLSPGNPRALFLQAVLATRGGKIDAARKLMNRIGDALDDVPAAILLQGVLELRAGNADVAVEALDRLVRKQPANPKARLLLAHALYAAGEYKYLVSRFAADAARPTAPPYLLTLVGRAYEAIDDRASAAPLLDRAARAVQPFVEPCAECSPVGSLLQAGQTGAALAQAERQRAANPASADAQIQAGDVQLALGHGAEALERYQIAARIRLPESLFMRMVEALSQAKRGQDAVALTEVYLARNPASRATIRLAAGLSAQSGDWQRARRLLEYLRDTGADNDPRLMADLSLTMLRTGDPAGAVQAAERGWRMQRSSPIIAQAWGMALAASGEGPATAAALLAKAQAVLGDNPMLAEGRKALAARAKR